ncbi:MAG: hypothetical protein ACRDKE_06815, partial [Solirubrobacterales bacterium]
MKLRISYLGRTAAVAPHLIGAVFALLIALLQSTDAHATLPRSVDVMSDARADRAAVSVPLADTPLIRSDYNVMLRGKKNGTTIPLSGVPLLELLTIAGVSTQDVQFVKIRYGTNDDSAISLIALNQSNVERPPMILASGKAPNRGPFPTPAVVPGQPDFAKPISEKTFIPFSTTHHRLTLIPGAPGAKIMSVKLRAARRKSGEYMVRASVSRGGSPSAKSYTWFGYDSNG